MSEESSNSVVLYVRCGRDSKVLGTDVACQRATMILRVKANRGLTSKVVTINPSEPPPEFESISNRLPTLVHGTKVIKGIEEIVDYVDERFPEPPLSYDNKRADSATLHVFTKLNYFLKNVGHPPHDLLKELKRINDYLESVGTRFMCGDDLTHLDCMVLPKLQHVRIASKVFKDYEIPEEFEHLLRYLHNGCQNDVFSQTCPSDEEIVNYWIDCAGLQKP